MAPMKPLLTRRHGRLDASPPYVSASCFPPDDAPPTLIGEIDALNRQLARARQQFPTSDAIQLFRRAHRLLTQGGIGAQGLFAALTETNGT